ncbi:MAG: nitroreductase family protein [Desulfobacterales bacterium]|nr:nitroreductase family protein [Desulfobacterales bacterium]
MLQGEKFRKEFEKVEIAGYEPLLGLLKFRRSIRGFKRKKVPRELIEKMIGAARWAPSGGNSQPWEFVVVEDNSTIQKLAEMYEYQSMEKKWLEPYRDDGLQFWARDRFPGLDDPQLFCQSIEKVKGKAPFRKAPCLIFPLADRRWEHAFPLRTRLERGQQHTISGLASVVYALHLAAAALGLATQWISDFESPWLSGMTKGLLGIPQDYMIYEALPVGYPTYYPKPRYVKPLEELIHYGSYDAARNKTTQEIIDYIEAHHR